MSTKRPGTVHDPLRTLFQAGSFTGLTDRQLLERFAVRDGETAELAFAALVDRHGGIVLSTCRSVLHDDHAARDAFQATFLVLLRKAGSLWVRDSLGPWLHRVAYRAASHARRDSDRRRRAEREAAGRASERVVESGCDDLASVLHEEIDRLPDRYRIPLVLCDLEGRTYEEAAVHLGCPVGTVKSRLARGRERLRGRLIRRGLAPASGLAAMEAGRRSASAAAPPALIESVVRAFSGGNVIVGAVSASAISLAEGVIKTMIRAKLSQIAAGTLAVFVITMTGWLLFAGQGSNEGPRNGAGQTPRVAGPKIKSPEIAKEMIGAWVLAGTPDRIEPPPAAGEMLKFFGGRHWAITQADPKTGEVIYHHGGTYKLDGDVYFETIEYATANTANLIKQTHKFKINVEGDTYTQVGLDNQWSQVWKRAK